MTVDIVVKTINISTTETEHKLTGRYELVKDGQEVADATFGEAYSPKKFVFSDALTQSVDNVVRLIRDEITRSFGPEV